MVPAFSIVQLAPVATPGVAVTVVIDVIRAFTTAAVAFSRGAREIILVRHVEEASALRQKMPEALLMGEVEGLPIPGFDFGNSPVELEAVDLTNRVIIQRTSAGTQGVVAYGAAEHLMAASFVCAGATLASLREQAPTQVTWVPTGTDDGDEDWALAEYLTARWRNPAVAAAPYLQRVREGAAAQKFYAEQTPLLDARDIAACAQVDRFDFALRVKRRAGHLTMTPEIMP